VVEVQEERCGIALAPPCRAHLALSAPDVPLSLLERGTGSVVVLISWIVYPTMFPPNLPAFFSIEIGICFFLRFPLVLGASQIVAWELAYDGT